MWQYLALLAAFLLGFALGSYGKHPNCPPGRWVSVEVAIHQPTKENRNA